jgi:hypothetical protein
MHRTWAILTATVGLLAGLPFQTLAQDRSREVALDLRPFSADLSIAWESSTGHLWGLLVGGGPDEFNKTFVPEVDDTDPDYVTLEQIIRVGPFYRYERGGRLSVDVGLRAALGGVRGTSGAISAVGGLQTAVFFGGRRFRVGPRLFVGRSTEADVSNIVHVDWVTARLRLPF